MGAWGLGISSNDTFSDIYQQFFDLYGEGMEIIDISAKPIRANQEIIEIPEDSNNFWFALAKAQWECKSLDKGLFEKVKDIIVSGNDLKVWSDLGATKADLKIRQKNLNKFLDTLQSEKPKPRKREKKKLYNSIFKKGDCLVYKMENEKYGGAFVLADEENSETGSNLIAITTIEKSEIPTIKDFEKAEVIVKRRKELKCIIENNKLKETKEYWLEHEEVGWISAMNWKNGEYDIKVIGSLPVTKTYTTKADFKVGFGWHALFVNLPRLPEYENINGKPNKRLKLKNIRKKHWL
jgi:hypothetical protein